MLNALKNVNGARILSKAAQKELKGGVGTCGAYLPAGEKSKQTVHVTGKEYEFKSGAQILRGVSKSEALALVSGVSGAHWCCDSCSEASWY